MSVGLRRRGGRIGSRGRGGVGRRRGRWLRGGFGARRGCRRSLLRTSILMWSSNISKRKNSSKHNSSSNNRHSADLDLSLRPTTRSSTLSKSSPLLRVLLPTTTLLNNFPPLRNPFSLPQARTNPSQAPPSPSPPPAPPLLPLESSPPVSSSPLPNLSLRGFSAGSPRLPPSSRTNRPSPPVRLHALLPISNPLVQLSPNSNRRLPLLRS